MTVDIARLPRRNLRTGTKLYRIHRKINGPWYFANSLDGRFNPTTKADRGTCYWGETPLAAWVEVFRSVMTLTDDDIEDRALSAIALNNVLPLANLTVKRALAAGVTVALSSGQSYTSSQKLAGDLQGITDGVRYRVRHDPSAKLIGIAWFGDVGPADVATLSTLPDPTTADIPASLVNEACRLFGYKVLPSPAP